jgi:hypothetical protein
MLETWVHSGFDYDAKTMSVHPLISPAADPVRQASASASSSKQ